MKTSRFAKFMRPMALAVAALALTTAGIPAQPAQAMTKYQFCLGLVESYWDTMRLGDDYLSNGNAQAAIFQYQRAGAIANSFGELC